MGNSEDEITAAPSQGAILPNEQPSFDQGASSAFVPDPSSVPKDGAPKGPFAFSVQDLHRLIDIRNRLALRAVGGIDGLARGLATDCRAGLSIDEDIAITKISPPNAVQSDTFTETINGFEEGQSDVAPQSTPGSPGKFNTRREYFGENRVPRRKPKSFLQLLWLAYNDKLMFLLSASAVVSLALGIYQSTRPDEDGPRIEWVEGVTILAAVIIIVLATALNDYQKNSKFQKLNQRKEERNVIVTRSGQNRSISIFEVVVGDVLHIEAGDVLPADGILIEASSIQCDESSLTGESDLVDKASSRFLTGDPFVLSGTRVVAGVGRFLVVSVGVNSTYGRVLMSLDDDVQETPLQQKLGVMAKYIINVGFVAGIVFFVIMLARFLARLRYIEGGSAAKGQEFLELFILSITVVVIVVPEGLPLTVTLALALATTRMLKDNNLVRLLRSCETMGSATTVCSDKTGTLTENKMRIVTGCLGTSTRFGDGLATPGVATQLLPGNLVTQLHPDAAKLLKESLCLNSTTMETSTPGDFIGSGTETALLNFGRERLAMGPLGQERAQADIVHMVPFNATRKWMAVVTRTDSGCLRLMVKGAAEIVLDKCLLSLTDPQAGLVGHPLTPTDKSSLGDVFNTYAESLLRVVAIAYKDLHDMSVREDAAFGDTTFATLTGLTFIGAFGIRDPLRPNVAESVRQCQDAGVFVRMVTGDNFVTAKAIASEAGIYTPGGIALDGPTFRRLTTAQLDLVAPRLQVLARSSPEDKRRLVSHLKTLDEVVAVTGDGTNDALALKAADVGFSMGISGTEVAKEASAIVLMDDNFASIVKAIAWGRAVNDAAKKFLQFQFTINVTAGSLTIITALISGAESSVFTVVQLLWINLIMDTFAALALSPDFPTQTSLQRRPEPRSAKLLGTTAWKMIMGQSTYQMAVIFTLFYAGPNLYSVQNEHDERALQTMIFNIYVWMQFFNQSNSRRTDNNLNIFEGVHRNPWFVFVQAVTLAGQLVIVFVGGQAFNTVRLSAAQWGWSMLFGILTIPIGAAIRLVPDELIYKTWLSAAMPFQAMAGRLSSSTNEEGETNVTGFWSRVKRVGTRSAKLSGRRADREAHAAGDVQLPAVVTSEMTPSENLFDLEGAIDASRYGTSARPAGFEVHPATLKHDPGLDTQTRPEGFPPSQDEKLRHYMGIGC